MNLILVVRLMARKQQIPISAPIVVQAYLVVRPSTVVGTSGALTESVVALLMVSASMRPIMRWRVVRGMDIMDILDFGPRAAHFPSCLLSCPTLPAAADANPACTRRKCLCDSDCRLHCLLRKVPSSLCARSEVPSSPWRSCALRPYRPSVWKAVPSAYHVL